MPCVCHFKPIFVVTPINFFITLQHVLLIYLMLTLFKQSVNPHYFNCFPNLIIRRFLVIRPVYYYGSTEDQLNCQVIFNDPSCIQFLQLISLLACLVFPRLFSDLFFTFITTFQFAIDNLLLFYGLFALL